jgi:hypothetical protein
MINDYNKYFGLHSELFRQQRAFNQRFEINTGLSAVMNSLSPFLKATEHLRFKNEILTSITNSSALSIARELQKRTDFINRFNSNVGLSGLATQITQMQRPYYTNNFNNVISPILQIQKSLNSLYASKSAFANYNSIFNNSSFIGQMKDLNVAISGISNYLKVNPTSQSDNFYDDSEIGTILNETAVITSNINETRTVTYEEFLLLKNKIDAIYEFIISKHKKITLWFFITLLLFKIEPLLNDILQQAQRYYDNKESVTKKDIEELEHKFQLSWQEMSQMLLKQDIRFAKYPCNLKLKYYSKSQTIFRIVKGQELFVLQIKGKWLQVSIIDSKDNSEITGWVLKKYIKEKLPRK